MKARPAPTTVEDLSNPQKPDDGSYDLITADTNLSGNQTGSNNLLKEGNTIHGLYTIKSKVHEGNMGVVYHIHHNGWKVDLAMKQINKKKFKGENIKNLFKDECENWIKLGLHPHIVSCYYVRDMDGDGELSMFTEWMNGGSLKKYINSGALYKGSEKEIQERILDIAIQVARGLHYAHQQGLIHQDVKPDNLLLATVENSKMVDVKVADFGLSGGKFKAINMDTGAGLSTGISIVADGFAGTTQYCSPEQKNQQEVTRRTDIWSWAVSVLEMYTGGIMWDNGSEVGRMCEQYFGMAENPIPEDMKVLLRWCLSENEADRPHDFGVIEAELIKIYEAETSHTYPRPEPEAASLTAGSLNNRALSYLDMRKPEEAEKCWEEAVQIDPNNSTCQYNYSLHLWKTARIDDMEALRRLKHITNKDANYYFCLAKLHLARADAESAVEFINEAIAKFGETKDFISALSEAQEMIDKGLDGRCMRTHKVHSGSVYSVCFFPNGKHVLSSGEKIKMWNCETGEYIRTFEKHTNNVTTLCIDPAGKQFLSGSYDESVVLWDINKSEWIRFFYPVSGGVVEEYGGGTKAVCFCPDGKHFISASENGTVKRWEIETGECVYILEVKRHIYSVCFSPDCKHVLVVTVEGSFHDTKINLIELWKTISCTIELWDIETGKCIHYLHGHKGPVTFVGFSSDGLLINSISEDNTIKIWDFSTRKCIHTFQVLVQTSRVSFSPDNRLILTGGYAVKIKDVSIGLCIRTLKEEYNFSRDGRTFNDTSVCFSPDGSRAISGTNCGSVNIWTIPKEPPYEMILSQIQLPAIAIGEYEYFHSTIAEIDRLIVQKDISTALAKLNTIQKMKSFEYSDEYFLLSRKIASYCKLGQLRRYKIQKKFKGQSNDCSKFHCAKDNNKTQIWREDGKKIRLWDLETNQYIKTLEGNLGCISADCRRALTYDGDSEFKLWDLTTGECIRNFKVYNKTYRINCHKLCLSPNGQMAILNDGDVWGLINIEKNKYHDVLCLNVLSSYDYSYGVVCFSPDGRHALIGSGSSYPLKLWHTTSCVCLRTYKLEKNKLVYSICFNQDGTLAIIGYNYETTIILDVATGKYMRTLEKSDKFKWAATSVCFSPDGRLALSRYGSTFKLWDVETGQCIQIFRESENEFLRESENKVSKVYFIDKQTIVAELKEGIHIYNLNFDLHFPGWRNWDEGARPYLKIFLALYPKWTDEDFNNILIPDLQNKGYGWLRPDRVRKELKKMTVKWQKNNNRTLPAGIF